MTGAQKLYQRVADAITTAIAQGQYAVGSRLPAERDLAEEFSVSRPTIREAMIALEIRGLVGARKGSGIYVMATPAELHGVLCGMLCCSATSVPITVNTARPKASAISRPRSSCPALISKVISQNPIPRVELKRKKSSVNHFV